MAVTKKEGFFLVVAASQETDRNGRTYYKMKLKEPISEGGNVIDGKMWNEIVEIRNSRGLPMPEKGQYFTQTVYDADSWQGTPQYVIRDYDLVDKPTKEQRHTFLEPPCVDTLAILKELFLWEGWEPAFKELFQNILKDLGEEGVEKLRNIPAGEVNHHNRRGGLLQHTNEMVNIGKCLVEGFFQEAFPGLIDYQVLRAGTILHDLGKVHDYDPELLVWDADITSRLFEHSQWGILLIERCKPKDLSKVDSIRMMSVQHCVLTHHGRSIAPVAPSTAEACLLHEIDAISAYMDVFRTVDMNGEEPAKRNFMMGTKPIWMKGLLAKLA